MSDHIDKNLTDRIEALEETLMLAAVKAGFALLEPRGVEEQ